MPPTKRTTGTAAAVTRRSKRFRPLAPATDLEEAGPSTLNAPPEEAGAGTMRVNVQALTSTIATAVSQAVKEALAAQLPGSVPPQTNQHHSSTATPDVEGLDNEEVATLTSREGTPGPLLHSSPWDSGDQPRKYSPV